MIKKDSALFVFAHKGITLRTVGHDIVVSLWTAELGDVEVIRAHGAPCCPVDHTVHRQGIEAALKKAADGGKVWQACPACCISPDPRGPSACADCREMTT